MKSSSTPNGVAMATSAPTIDPIWTVTVVPVTWAGEAYLRHGLAVLGASEALVAVCLDIWRFLSAVAERVALNELKADAAPPLIGSYERVYNARLQGFDEMGPTRLYFNVSSGKLMRLDSNGSGRELLVRGNTLSTTAHLHEWTSTLGWRLAASGSASASLQVGGDNYKSAFNKAMTGTRSALAMLGIPIVERIAYPAVFTEDDVRFCDDSIVEMRHIGRLRPANDQLDVVEYFMALWRDGRLPLDTEEDVRRFVVTLALPLIRYLAIGLLGVCWFIGPPGAGKDFLAELGPDTWHAALEAPTSKSKFDLDNGKDELEMKRNISQAGGAVYARAKEAAKRGEAFITALIRLGGTDQIPARAMRENEIEIENTFTIVADSAEDLPDRREVHRRTLLMHVRRLDEDALGEVRAEILSRAPEIIASLKRIVETQPPEYFTQQRNTNGRPVGQVALARLFGVNLEAVVGRNLDDLWDALIDFSNSAAAQAETQIATDRFAQDKRVADDVRAVLDVHPRALQVFRLSAMVKASTDRLSVHHLFFANYRSTGGIVNLIKREGDYATQVRKRGYLRVETGSGAYALRLLRGDRYVLWMPEAVYQSAMALAPLPGGPAPIPALPDSPAALTIGSVARIEDRIADEHLASVVSSVLAHVPVKP